MILADGSPMSIGLRRYTGRTSKLEDFASIESPACSCCGRPLLNHQWPRA